MKIQTIIIIILAAALLAVGWKYIAMSNTTTTTDADATTGASPHNTTGIYNDIMTRSSVRQYTDRTLSPEQIDSLCRAAMAAPTAVNRQPWQIVVIDDRAILDTIAAEFKNISMASQAPVAFTICGDLSLALEGDGQAYWIQDCSAATENLLLAAHGMGLGAVWCGIYPIEDRVAKLRTLLNLPDHIVPLNVIPVGYSKGPGTPKEKFDSAKVHYNKF